MLKMRCLHGVHPLKPIGSYKTEDAIFLLKDISNAIQETGTEDREELIQRGKHYSEMLPIEYKPTKEYLDLFHQTLLQTADKVALSVGTVAELILKKRGEHLVIASLARAGTPIGVLIKRYLKYKYQIDMPHYSLSIIRGKGIDKNAIFYILQNHREAEIQFVDGWTGKGAITQVLKAACDDFYQQYSILLNSELAVLADPGHCVATFGTREDFLIPSACLNSTVSGLVSRTVLRDDLVGPHDFHGAKFYREWRQEDVSNLFVDRIAECFPNVLVEAEQRANQMLENPSEVTWSGLRDIGTIQKMFKIKDINLIKPGVGETTRVLLRRVPWKILVNDLNNPYLKHITILAKERGVPIEEFYNTSYSCCGIIRSVGEEVL